MPVITIDEPLSLLSRDLNLTHTTTVNVIKMNLLINLYIVIHMN